MCESPAGITGERSAVLLVEAGAATKDPGGWKCDWEKETLDADTSSHKWFRNQFKAQGIQRRKTCQNGDLHGNKPWQRGLGEKDLVEGEKGDTRVREIGSKEGHSTERETRQAYRKSRKRTEGADRRSPLITGVTLSSRHGEYEGKERGPSRRKARVPQDPAGEPKSATMDDYLGRMIKKRLGCCVSTRKRFSGATVGHTSVEGRGGSALDGDSHRQPRGQNYEKGSRRKYQH